MVLAIYEEDLLDEVTAIVEYPEVLRAQFAEEFLQVPQEALVAAMQDHQKSFPVFDQANGLLPYFIFVANIKSKKPAAVIAGNEKVMHARLFDAAFFYHTDLKTPLVDRLPKLKTVVFQQKLGDLYQRSERIAALSEFIAQQLNTDSVQAKRAGLLCKCDLMSDMVYEFTELQGIMGAYYAAHDGEAASVVQAVRQHYQPEFSGDDLPAEETGICVALSDKLDLLVGIFAIGMRPTGDKDPYGLRRAAIGVLRLLIEKQLNLDIAMLIDQAIKLYTDLVTSNTKIEVIAYINERLKHWYIEQGIVITIFNAVAAQAITNLNDFNARIMAVKYFISLPAAENLAAANKRVDNILKKNNSFNVSATVKPELLEEKVEKALYEAVVKKQKTIISLLATKDYMAILSSLVDLQAPLDVFFADVMVMVDDTEVKNNRLALLKAVHDLFATVADITELS